jgi:hypothetical protein
MGDSDGQDFPEAKDQGARCVWRTEATNNTGIRKIRSATNGFNPSKAFVCGGPGLLPKPRHAALSEIMQPMPDGLC